MQLECHVGHTFVREDWLEQQAEAIESQLWLVLRSFKDRARLLRQLAIEAEQQHNFALAQSYARKAQHALNQVERLHQVLSLSELRGRLRRCEM